MPKRSRLRRAELYSGDKDAAVALGVIGLIVLAAAFAAGLVAIYIIKFRKPKSESKSVLVGLSHSFMVAIAATCAILAGSFSGSVFLGARFDFWWVAYLFALPFFFETFIALFIVNRLIVHFDIRGWGQAALAALLSFLVFTFLNTCWLLLIDQWHLNWAIVDILAMATSYGVEQIKLPAELVLEAFRRGEFLFPFRWAWHQFASSGGNQFVLVKIFPAVFFVYFSVAMLALGLSRGRQSEDVSH